MCGCVRTEISINNEQSLAYHRAVVSFSSFSAIRRAQNIQITAHNDAELTVKVPEVLVCITKEQQHFAKINGIHELCVCAYIIKASR